jgi:triosephosphate isomerase
MKEWPMRKLIAGNWKMNGLHEQGRLLAGALYRAVDKADIGCELLVCPPATLIYLVREYLHRSPVMVGGQDCHANAKGAHTGDVSAEMLRDLGAGWVIVGHSERRADHGETDAQVKAKAYAARRAGLTAIICVGETEAQRVAGAQNDVVGAQLLGSLPAEFQGVIAYEPVWAIGTGLTPTPADVADMHSFIRKTLVSHLGEAGRRVRILYGGSVKPSNAQELLHLPEVGGALVGGASLVAKDFIAIAKAAAAVAEAPGAG